MGKDKGKQKEAKRSKRKCRKAKGGKRKQPWPSYSGGGTAGIRKDTGSSLTQDLHSVVLHSLPVLAGHDAAVGARVLLLGIQDLQPVATWAKGIS